MALRSSSSSPRRDLGHPDSPSADSPPPTFQVGSGNGAKADVDHLLAKLEKEGVKIDGKIASIIDARISKIKAEATETTRGDINKPGRDRLTQAEIAAGVALGFVLGMKWFGFLKRRV